MSLIKFGLLFSLLLCFSLCTDVFGDDWMGMKEAFTKKKKRRGGFFGISILETNEIVSKYKRFEKPAFAGLVIRAVIPGSTASVFGFLSGDTIISLDNQECSDAQLFMDLVHLKSRGQKVLVQFARNGNLYRITVSMKKRPKFIPKYILAPPEDKKKGLKGQLAIIM